MNTEFFDQAIADLQKHKRVWARLPIGAKIEHFQQIFDNTVAVAQAWVDASVTGKQIPYDSPWSGEEWTSGPWAVIRAAKGYIHTLQGLKRGKPRHWRALRTRDNGQVVVEVFPETIYDNMLLNGFRAEVWMQPEVTQANLRDHMAVFYQQENPEGKVALVLGAGNINSIPALDVMYKLIADGSVCILKLNPVNEYLAEPLQKIFSSLIEAGFVRIVCGGAEVGEYLVHHAGVEEVHITGSDKTHDMIVYGAGEAGQQRKTQDERILKKPITSELGGVGPTIVVPGPWTEDDLQFQAEHIVTQKMHNGGFNCVAMQVLVMPENWELAPKFLEKIERTLTTLLKRSPYYPGADKRQQEILENHRQSTMLTDEYDEAGQPRMMVTGVDPNNKHDVCFTQEVFSAVMVQTSLPGDDPVTFLQNAVKFCNETLHGTLSANILIHPKTMQQIGKALEQAVEDLNYGAIGVNAWAGVAYFVDGLPWGAAPGHTYQDIQSGIGWVHNSYLFDKPQKSVAYGPFKPFPRCVMEGEFHMSPRPLYFVTNKTAHTTGKRFMLMEADENPIRLPALFYSALRG